MIAELKALGCQLERSAPNEIICGQVAAILTQARLLLDTLPIIPPFDLEFFLFHGVEHMSLAGD